MKRVQMILDDWHVEWLNDQSKQQSTSMSALLRQILGEAIERRQVETWEEDPIWGIVGIAEGPNDGITSENLDEFLYQYPPAKPATKEIAEKDAGDR